MEFQITKMYLKECSSKLLVLNTNVYKRAVEDKGITNPCFDKAKFLVKIIWIQHLSKGLTKQWHNASALNAIQVILDY